MDMGGCESNRIELEKPVVREPNERLVVIYEGILV